LCTRYGVVLRSAMGGAEERRGDVRFVFVSFRFRAWSVVRDNLNGDYHFLPRLRCRYRCRYAAAKLVARREDGVQRHGGGEVGAILRDGLWDPRRRECFWVQGLCFGVQLTSCNGGKQQMAFAVKGMYPFREGWLVPVG
jgi:hypothetical protein